jgi:dynactin complex subunit
MGDTTIDEIRSHHLSVSENQAECEKCILLAEIDRLTTEVERLHRRLDRDDRSVVVDYWYQKCARLEAELQRSFTTEQMRSIGENLLAEERKVVALTARNAALEKAIKALDPFQDGCEDPNERIATSDEVDDGCELGIAYDGCGRCLSCLIEAALDSLEEQ